MAMKAPWRQAARGPAALANPCWGCKVGLGCGNDSLCPAARLERCARATNCVDNSRDPVPYGEAIATMDARASAIFDGFACECVWPLAHPCVYTAGTSAKPADLVDPARFPVIPADAAAGTPITARTARGLCDADLSRRGRDVRGFVRALEDWLIATLARLGVEGERRPGAVGIFVGGTSLRRLACACGAG